MRRRWTLEEAQKLAKKKGGICLSEKYVNFNSKLRWQCSQGHIWETTLSKISIGRWCHDCSPHKKLTIEKMQKLAAEKGGKCLSKIYNNKDGKLEWECADGHRWFATGGSVKRISWCPVCSKSGISERICRVTFERLFNEPFSKIRPSWLLSPKGKLMELDGFCEKLKIAFEYQGQQHFAEVAHFNRNKTLAHQQNHDAIKRRLCQLNDVILIEIPFNIKKDYIPTYIVSQLLQKKIKLPEGVNPIYFDDMKKEISSPHRLMEMKKLASLKEGLCLSSEYVDARTKMMWRCKMRHTWKATPNDVQQGKWCPTCARVKVSNSRRLTIQEMKEIADSRGGKCLSLEYKNNRTPLVWECKNGHSWKASADNIKAGKWCVKCHRLSIEDMQDLAKAKGGVCLSTGYTSDRVRLLWQCKHKHEWYAFSSNIKRGTWCPNCYKNKLRGIIN